MIHQNQITWFGWKVHLVSDCKAELPVDFVITPANEADSIPALPLVDKVCKRFNEQGYEIPKYWTMDSGYDVKNIYSELHKKYDAQAIIPINKRGAKQQQVSMILKVHPCAVAAIRWFTGVTTTAATNLDALMFLEKLSAAMEQPGVLTLIMDMW